MRYILIGIGVVMAALAFAGALMMLWDDYKEHKSKREDKR